MAESITITDNRSGESLEIPIENGGVSAAQWSKLLPGIWFYDPGFVSTAACESSITYLDGDEGILRYRGYPIEQLAEKSTYLEVAYLLLNGELPHRGPVRRVATRDHHSTPSSTRTFASASSRASTTTPTRWACWSRRWPPCPPSTSTPRTSSTPSPATSRSSGSSPRCRPWPPPPTASAWACRSSTRTTRCPSPPTSSR